MTTRVFAVDPGFEQSALVVYDGVRIVEHGLYENEVLLDRISDRCRSSADVLVVEQIAAMGMSVGEEVFETVHWAGRFIQSWHGYRKPFMPWERMKRHEVKMALCGNMRAKDANIRTALLDRFGPGKEKAIGKKAKPGPLYGIAGDEWSALAIAMVWWDKKFGAATAL